MNASNTGSRANKRYSKIMWVVGCIALGVALGYVLSGTFNGRGQPSESKQRSTPADDSESNPGKKTGEVAHTTVWTCSMHPQIQLPKPGKCPICYMDLIPLNTGGDAESAGGPRNLTISEDARRLAEVQTSEVKRRKAKVLVGMAGMVFEDETRVAALTSRVDGRLDEVYVNFTGVTVNKGDPMVKIWSPTLIKSQVELFESMRSIDSETVANYGIDASAVIKGAEEKLIQQGLTQRQIEAIKKTKKPDLYVTLRAPINGIVLKKMAVLGQFVKEGSEMYMINDLSKVWVKMDAYETDLPWIRFGQDVRFTTPAIPGRSFTGKVLFVDPTLDLKTRSVKVRVEVDNPDLLLKPGMFVSAELEAEVDTQGRVIKSEWAGKFICPGHPSEPPRSEPGFCPETKAPLRPVSAYGYVDEKDPVLPLTIPATAPLITGKRAIVYVEVPNTDQPTYALREVVLGPRAGDLYVVYKGLEEGERVVTSGNFKIDSAMQILARTSMMAPKEMTGDSKPAKSEEDEIERVQAPVAFLKSLNPALDAYAALKKSLVEEKAEETEKAAAELRRTLKVVDAGLLDGAAQESWNEVSGTMTDGLERMSAQKDLAILRRQFDPVSEAFARMLMTFRHVATKPVKVFFCREAFDGQGAYWVEIGTEKSNPYWGGEREGDKKLLECGELVSEIPPVKSDGKKEKADGGK